MVLPFVQAGFTIYSSSIITTDGMIEKKPDLVRRFLRAAQASWNAAQANPQETCELHVKANPEVEVDDCVGSVRATLGFVFNDHSKATGLGYYAEDRFKFTSRTDLSDPRVRAAFSGAFFPELIPNFVDEYADGVRPRLTVALLNGDIALVGASGEFFSNHSIRLKERARVKQLFFFGYCNGYHQYFPTIEAVSEGGYGADSTVSPVAVGAGEQMMNTGLIWIYQMLGKIH